MYRNKVYIGVKRIESKWPSALTEVSKCYHVPAYNYSVKRTPDYLRPEMQAVGLSG